MADEITITIDGVEVKTTPDKMVIQAAGRRGDIYPVPVLLPRHEAVRRVPHVRGDG